MIDTLLSFCDKYGPVHTFWLGETPFIFVTDYELMIKYFVKNGDKFADRIDRKEAQIMFSGGQFGIAINSGEPWRVQRRFAMHTLRNFGMGKNKMEQNVRITIIQY